MFRSLSVDPGWHANLAHWPFEVFLRMHPSRVTSRSFLARLLPGLLAISTPRLHERYPLNVTLSLQISFDRLAERADVALQLAGLNTTIVCDTSRTFSQAPRVRMMRYSAKRPEIARACGHPDSYKKISRPQSDPLAWLISLETRFPSLRPHLLQQQHPKQHRSATLT